MAASLNLHRLFYVDEGYLRALRVTSDDEQYLSRAREKIRSTLKEAFRNWEQYLTRAEAFDRMVAAGEDVRLSPKFRIQGSFAYHTVNDCQITPPQQVDQDDGLFLPVRFITNGGAIRPRISSTAYFKIVEQALRPLCAKEGWVLNPGGEKASCVRIGLTSRLHIDLPLYAVRDEAFETLTETSARMLAKADSAAAMDRAFNREQVELSEDIYRALSDSEIVLAHREDWWIGSDPRKLELWFDNALMVYGPIVRRLSRAFKGLRDAHWSDAGLGSICIMAAVVTAVARLHPLQPNRDDLALLNVGREMVDIFAGTVDNPGFPGHADKALCKDWTPEFRQEVRRVFREACDKLERAINHTLHKGHAIDLAREAFGSRVPDDQGLISIVGAAAVIREIEPAPQPKPMVPRTRSG